ncbi:cobalt-precorrin-4 C(11)-methyltransferase, partial [Patescibacteria group bacterium]|nr:cobalt-precorrin-4 C(11)-methyltransferase [Patescibacteria group bacterium]
ATFVNFSTTWSIIEILKKIAKKVKEAKIKRQALIIVGDVLRKKYQKSKLYDKDFEHGFRRKI